MSGERSRIAPSPAGSAMVRAILRMRMEERAEGRCVSGASG